MASDVRGADVDLGYAPATCDSDESVLQRLRLSPDHRCMPSDGAGLTGISGHRVLQQALRPRLVCQGLRFAALMEVLKWP